MLTRTWQNRETAVGPWKVEKTYGQVTATLGNCDIKLTTDGTKRIRMGEPRQLDGHFVKVFLLNRYFRDFDARPMTIWTDTVEHHYLSERTKEVWQVFNDPAGWLAQFPELEAHLMEKLL